MRHLVAMLLVAAWMPPRPTGPPPDHLVPEAGALAGPLLEYDADLARLLRGEDPCTFQLAVIPAFAPEALVCLEDGRLSIRRASRNVWSARWSVQEDEGPRPLAPVEVIRIDLPLTDGEMDTLRQLWWTALRGVRSPDGPEMGFDGVTYHFSACLRSGWMWSPEPATRMAALAEVADRIVGLLDLDDRDRTWALIGIHDLAARLLDDLERDLDPVEAVVPRADP